MALSDPELELLSELLTELPTADCLFSVTETLIQRGRDAEALFFFRAAKADEMEDPACWLPYALTACRCNQFGEAFEVLSELDDSAFSEAPVAAARVKILGCCGQLESARSQAEAYFKTFGPDEHLAAFVADLKEEDEDERLIALDPSVSNHRAEAFVAIGRADRAIRIYRRLAHHHPNRMSVQRRLQELLAGDFDREDDLSEELELQRQPLEFNSLPDFSMPGPQLAATHDDLDRWIKASGVSYDVPIYAPTVGERIILTKGDRSTPPVGLEVTRSELKSVSRLSEEDWEDELTDPSGFSPDVQVDERTDPGHDEGLQEHVLRPNAAPTNVVDPDRVGQVQSRVKRARRRRSILKK